MAIPEDTSSAASAIPEIEFVSLTPSSATEYQDSIVITISYIDGDGDLGSNIAEDRNLYVIDSRNEVAYQFRIQQLAPDGEEIAIQGNLPVVLKNTAILDGSSSETVSYSVYVIDRAGNQSNTVDTDGITVIN